MATDSTELTFVRCPSCRSLVPASQTRCRMCGASLDAGTQQGGDDAARKSGRVKQRTMSQPQSDLNSAADQLRKEHKSSGMEELPDSGDEISVDDPLSGYVEEVESTETDAPAEAPAAKSANGGGYASHERPKEAPPMPPKPRDEQKPKVFAESGRKQSGGLSFNKERSEPPVARNLASAAESDDAWSSVNEELPVEEPMREPRASREKEQRHTPPSAAPAREGAKKAEQRPGRLFGWLVSYANPDGSALELREGKFFVTAGSLKPSDMIIQDPSISTPHALVNISAAQGFAVQDLMSDRGVWIRRREGDTYQREESLQVKHGDWLRFGDVEYLVTLIAHVGAK